MKTFGLILFSFFLSFTRFAFCAVPENAGFEKKFVVKIQTGAGDTPEDEIKRLSGAGNPFAQFYYGYLLVRGAEADYDNPTANKLFEQSFPKLSKLAKTGDLDAAYLISLGYTFGYGTSVNKKKGFRLRLQLAEKKYAPAMFSVGMDYYNGEGVKTDRDKAEYWLACAAQDGVARAAEVMGDIYRFYKTGCGHLRVAYIWYHISAARGSAYGARMKEEIKPRLTRGSLREAYGELTGEYSSYLPGKPSFSLRLLLALGVIFPWVKFMVLDDYIWLDAAGFALAAFLLSLAMYGWRKLRFITDIPRVPIGDIFIGWVHVKGLIDCEGPLRSPLGGAACVFYRWAVREEWERTVLEEYTDRDGKKQLREKKERGETVIASGGDEIPFDLSDETGRVNIGLRGAEFDTINSFYRSCGPEDPLYYGFTDAPDVPDTLRRRVFSESVLPAVAEATVFGQAAPFSGEEDTLLELGRRTRALTAEAKAKAAPLFKIAEDKAAPFYLLSLSDASVQKKKRSSSIKWLSGVSLFFILLFPLSRLFFLEDKPGLAGFTLMCLAAYSVMFLLFWFWMSFNGLVYLHNRVKQIESLIEVQFKRRGDLVNSLASAAKDCLRYEKGLLEAVARLRGRNFFSGGETYSAAALFEAYPELLGEKVIKRLVDGIIDGEDRVAGAKRSWLDAVTAYNKRLERSPDRFLMSLGLFRPVKP